MRICGLFSIIPIDDAYRTSSLSYIKLSVVLFQLDLEGEICGVNEKCIYCGNVESSIGHVIICGTKENPEVWKNIYKTTKIINTYSNNSDNKGTNYSEWKI